MNHLCLVIDKVTGQAIAEYTIEAPDRYYARHRAIDKFYREYPEKRSTNFYIDSIELPKEEENGK